MHSRGCQERIPTGRHVSGNGAPLCPGAACPSHSVCNATHNFEQRLARWLLICADRAHSDTFEMAREYLAQMLGASRPTVSIRPSF
ncbi:helix-turn-helix domain-containing protein [Acidisarcina polymorpha]|uniref:helix-turn-helix domain-containing protein n=1 Tax=Acidisarcina polymorpha TaxID=2211140 RepID=UPI001F26EA7C|nr:helix-turn-helix domain-containing protein [Acidisarcina polymorpha]